jgi:hypothetical protein
MKWKTDLSSLCLDPSLIRSQTGNSKKQVMSFTWSQNPKPMCNHTLGLKSVSESLCLMYPASGKDSLLHMLTLKDTSQSKIRIRSSVTPPNNTGKWVEIEGAHTHSWDYMWPVVVLLWTFLTYLCNQINVVQNTYEKPQIDIASTKSTPKYAIPSTTDLKSNKQLTQNPHT